MSPLLRIRPPPQFVHAGHLPATWDGADPRLASYRFDGVDIDLQESEFVGPAAALWCVTYLALVRQRNLRCRLLVPMNMGVCAHLAATGVFAELERRGVEIDDPGVVAAKKDKTPLPLTAFSTLHDAARITNEAFESLRETRRASTNVTAAVTELFSELANNAAEHSESKVGAFAWIQFVDVEQGPRFVCVVADGGIGVKEGLCKNPALRTRIAYDWDALELAARERVSGTQSPHRGIGLFAVAEDARQRGGSLLLHSGFGSLEIREERETFARRTRLFPGTLAYLALPA